MQVDLSREQLDVILDWALAGGKDPGEFSFIESEVFEIVDNAFTEAEEL